MKILNIKFFHIAKVFLASLCLFMACQRQVVDPVILSDFKKTGFLSDDYFQVFIKEPPDNRYQSIVERRESAYFKAAENIQVLVLEKIIDHLIGYNVSINNLKINDELIKNRIKYHSLLKKYLGYGSIAYEFYDEDESVTIVYRIHKKGLKKEIESFQPVL